ncbi:hypothetical protein [Thalassotalea ganghwensis]
MLYVRLLVISSLLSLVALTNAQQIEDESFDPFYSLKQTIEGQQLLELAENAQFDPALTKQQLDVLADTGIKAKSIEYEVAQYIAYISVYSAMSNFTEAKELLDKLHILGTRLGNDWILGLYFTQKAAIAMRQGNIIKGADYATQAVKLGEALDYEYLVAIAKALRAVFYSKLNKGADALQDFTEALTVFELNGDERRASNIYLNLVTLYLDRQEYEKALVASNKVTQMLEAQPRKDIRALAANYINRAITLSYLNQKEDELQAYIKAQEYAIKSNDIEILASIYANLSDYFLRNENYLLGVERAKRCIETAKKIENDTLIAICQLNQGLSHVYLNERELGFDLLNNALETIKKANMTSTLKDAYGVFIEAYQHLDDHKSANIWLEKRYQHLIEQLKQDNESYFDKMESNFQQSVADREQMLNSVKEDMMSNILTQEQLVNKLTIACGVIAFLLLISVVFNIRYRRKIRSLDY